MNKKKILILVMSCNQPHFINQEVVCRETWAKDVLEGKYANIEYYSYTGGWKIGNVSKDQHHVFCSSGDGVYQTFQKTSECLSLLKENWVEYDYVFRTNTSTVINVGLLDAFINSGIDENTVYCGEIYSIDVPCPGSYFCYARGNSVIFSKKIIDLILDWSKYVVVPETMFADDNIIGDIINTYHILRFEPYKNYLKSYGFAWYKSLPKTPELAAYNALNNGVSAWNDDDDSYEHLKNFISIQIKAYNDRRLEEDRLRHISKVVSVNKDNYDDELKFINEYMKAPIMYYSDSRMRDYRKYYD